MPLTKSFGRLSIICVAALLPACSKLPLQFKAHEEIYESLRQQAFEALQSGHYKDAESLLLSSIAEAERGKSGHILRLVSLADLADVYEQDKNYTSAVRCLEEVVTEYKKLLGPAYKTKMLNTQERFLARECAKNLSHLAELKEKIGASFDPTPLYQEALTLNDLGIGDVSIENRISRNYARTLRASRRENQAHAVEQHFALDQYDRQQLVDDLMVARRLRAEGELDAAGKQLQRAILAARRLRSDDLLSVALAQLGEVQTAENELNEAKRSYLQALPLLQKSQVLDVSAVVLTHLGELALDAGDGTAGSDYFAQARAAYALLPVPIDKCALAKILCMAAICNAKEKRFIRATKIYEKAEALLGKCVTKNDPLEMYISSRLSDLCDIQGDAPRAKVFLRRSTEAGERLKQSTKQQDVEELMLIGHWYALQNREDLKSHCDELSIRILGSDEQHAAQRAEMTNALAQYYYDKHQFERAASLFAASASQFIKLGSIGNLKTANALIGQAQANFNLGNYAEAEAIFSRCVHACRATPGNHELLLAQALQAQASNYFEEKKYTLAKPLYQEALALFDKLGVANNLDSGACLFHLATIAFIEHRFDQAKKLFSGALDKFKTKRSSDDLYVINAKSCLADTCSRLGQFSEAEALYKEIVLLSPASKDAITMVNRARSAYSALQHGQHTSTIGATDSPKTDRPDHNETR
jgi:tetratricopeptide (TPR) repeat protein